MNPLFTQTQPKCIPPLDIDFQPASLANRNYRRAVAQSGTGVPLVIGLERTKGEISRFETAVFPADHPRATENLFYAERLLKFLLWQRGAWKVYIGGSQTIGAHIARLYAANGQRAFDAEFMGKQVYQQPFTVIPCSPDAVPAANENTQSLGRHLNGCRIGFDLGASDLKISAVVDGKAIYSDEIVWEPTQQTDPQYHYSHIIAALKRAMGKLPRLDAIGGSSAGVYVNNRPMVASLFRGIPADRFDEIRTMFRRIRDELGVPLEVVNDGEVTALAGSMSLEDDSILGIAMGSSLAAGYVNDEGNITGWLNELAFAPVDYNLTAPVDEWSGNRGVGARYFSQQAVFRLAPQVGIIIPEGVTNAEKLKFVQEKLDAGHAGARQIWQTIGTYLGYAIPHYADFYALKHALILGRVTSGAGGNIILNTAQNVLRMEFPALAEKIHIQLPDEKSRRVGQSIAAASLPNIQKADSEEQGV